MKRNKILLLTFMLLLINVEAGSKKSQEVPAGLLSKKMAFEIGDCLTQASSIYALDSENLCAIKTLAVLRPLFNCVSIAYGFLRLHKALYVKNILGSQNLVDFLRYCMRGENIIIDFSILKKVKQIAFRTHKSNLAHANHKYVDDKKLYQFLWLAANKILPMLIFKLADIDFCICANLAELSELFRQKLMYEMILKRESKLQNNSV